MSENSSQAKRKQILITAVIILGIAGTIIGIKWLQINALQQSGGKNGPPLISVASREADSVQWSFQSKAVGTIAPVKGVTLSAELSGTVQSIDFESGQKIKKGTVLLRLDSSTEKAELAAAKASATLADINLKRFRELIASKSIAQAEFDLALAEANNAKAQVNRIQSLITKKTIVAPFDGLLGIRRVQLGQYLRAGDAVVSLQTTDPIYVNFYLPQDALAYISEGLSVIVTSDAFPNKTVQGAVTAVTNEIDQSTRMVEVQATLPNPERILTSGMHVEVQLLHKASRTALIIPSTSIVYASYGNSVFVVKSNTEDASKLTVEQRFIKVGERRGDFTEILSGIKAGDRIITDGAFKLYPNASILLQDAKALNPQLAPDPSDS